MGTSPVPRSPREYRTLTKAELCFFTRLPALSASTQMFRTDLLNEPRQKRKPRPLGSRGRSFASFGRMGTVALSLCVVGLVVIALANSAAIDDLGPRLGCHSQNL